MRFDLEDSDWFMRSVDAAGHPQENSLQPEEEFHGDWPNMNAGLEGTQCQRFNYLSHLLHSWSSTTPTRELVLELVGPEEDIPILGDLVAIVARSVANAFQGKPSICSLVLTRELHPPDYTLVRPRHRYDARNHQSLDETDLSGGNVVI